MRWPWPRQPAETGDAQLERVGAAIPERPLPTGPPANLATQLARLRQIRDLVWHYFPGTSYEEIAAAQGTPERPLTARRVALVHQLDPAHLSDVTSAELLQIAGLALRRPERLAHDPEVVAVAAATLDLLQAGQVCLAALGALPAVRPDPELATDTGRQAYAAQLRRTLRRRKRDLALEHTRAWWLNWGDDPPGPPAVPPPVPRAQIVEEIATLLPVSWGALGADSGQDAARPRRPGGTRPTPEQRAQVRQQNATTGWTYHMQYRTGERRSGGNGRRPVYLSDGELAEALRQAEERLVRLDQDERMAHRRHDL